MDGVVWPCDPACSSPGASSGGVLSDSDLKKVEDIKPLFMNLMGDLVQTSKRPDISSGDADCIKSTIRELMQISDELSSYEYLITIEKDMTDFGDNNPMQGVVKFAVDKSNAILLSERKRLAQLSDQCTRYPLSFGENPAGAAIHRYHDGHPEIGSDSILTAPCGRPCDMAHIGAGEKREAPAWPAHSREQHHSRGVVADACCGRWQDRRSDQIRRLPWLTVSRSGIMQTHKATR